VRAQVPGRAGGAAGGGEHGRAARAVQRAVQPRARCQHGRLRRRPRRRLARGARARRRAQLRGAGAARRGRAGAGRILGPGPGARRGAGAGWVRAPLSLVRVMVQWAAEGALHESELIGVAAASFGSQQGIGKGMRPDALRRAFRTRRDLWRVYAARRMSLGGSVGGPRVGAALCLGQLGR
jgi:hypothetical protein